MSLYLRVALLAATSLLAGCLLWPHTERVVPTVAGTIVRDGQPVSGADVYVFAGLRNGHCSPSKYVGTTDGSGHFSIRGASKFEVVAYLGDRISGWGVCIKDSGDFVEAYRSFGMGFPPISMTLVCDLARPGKVCVPGA